MAKVAVSARWTARTSAGSAIWIYLLATGTLITDTPFGRYTLGVNLTPADAQRVVRKAYRNAVSAQ